MISDDDRRAAAALGAEVNSALADGKEVVIWLASGKQIEGVTKVGVTDLFVSIFHPAMTWRFRVDHVVGFSAK